MSHEVARKVTRGQPYCACTAHTRTAGRAAQPRRPRTLLDPWCWRCVRRHLATGCSPEQIAGRLRREYPDDRGRHLSTETIYAALYILPRGALRSEVIARTASGAQGAATSVSGDGSTGPHPQDDVHRRASRQGGHRTVPGHWEIDLIKGAHNRSAVGTLVERTTRLVILAKMSGTDATSARQGFTKKLRHVPTMLRHTLTYDRGEEMTEHTRLAEHLAIRSSLLVHTAPDNAAPMRIPMACCVSICGRARTCRHTPSES